MSLEPMALGPSPWLWLQTGIKEQARTSSPAQAPGQLGAST